MAAERGDPSLHPHRTLISLSPGGGDAVVIREFDLTHKVFVAPEPTPHSASESSNSTSTTTACPVKLYNGFYIPVAKSRVDWYSPDVLIIGTDFHALRSKEKESADTSTNTASASITAVVDASNKQSCDNAKDLPSVTDSGYPISTSLWRRGTPITSAVETFRGESTDVSVSGYISHHRGISIEWRSRAITFYTGAYQIRDWNPPMLDGTDGADALKLGSQSEWFDLSKVLPDDVDLSCFADCLLIQLRSDWTPVNTTYSQGSLLSVRISDIKSNGIANCNFEILFEPTEDRSLESFSCTQNFIILSALVRVKSELSFWRYNDIKSETATAGADTITSASTKLSPAWTFCGSESSAQVRGISISPVDSDACDAYFATCNSFLQPSIYFLCDAAAGPDGVPRLDNALLNMTTTTTTSSSRTGSGVEDELTRLLPSCPLKLRSLPAQFNADGLVEYQREATSPDGTKIPYFVIGRRNMALDGSTPTLLYGYGGFEISLTPSYLAATGLTWLEQGGCYVVANIRGGGEFGPSWHQAALKQNRHKAYEDFAAVAEDLIRSGITRREKLAIRGGSNGGLLVGNLMVRRPDLFAAVICAVPLLDMKRYNKLLAGASWMAEYGNPDTEVGTNSYCCGFVHV
jgi:prolyl oligopeptidase